MNKKILPAIGTIATLAIPVATVISCGEDNSTTAQKYADGIKTAYTSTTLMQDVDQAKMAVNQAPTESDLGLSLMVDSKITTTFKVKTAYTAASDNLSATVVVTATFTDEDKKTATKDITVTFISNKAPAALAQTYASLFADKANSTKEYDKIDSKYKTVASTDIKATFDADTGYTTPGVPQNNGSTLTSINVKTIDATKRIVTYTATVTNSNKTATQDFTITYAATPATPVATYATELAKYVNATSSLNAEEIDRATEATGNTDLSLLGRLSPALPTSALDSKFTLTYDVRQPVLDDFTVIIKLTKAGDSSPTNNTKKITINAKPTKDGDSSPTTNTEETAITAKSTKGGDSSPTTNTEETTITDATT